MDNFTSVKIFKSRCIFKHQLCHMVAVKAGVLDCPAFGFGEKRMLQWHLKCLFIRSVRKETVEAKDGFHSFETKEVDK